MPSVKILIVDDEPDIIEFLSYNLKKEGYEVYSATNGRDAIELARSKFPHLILLDIMMPGMDGIETCENIRQIKELDDTIIAFLTARGEDYSHIAGLEAGADDYITKPIKPKVLLSRIKVLLKRTRISSFLQGKVSEIPLKKEGGLVIDAEKFVVMLGNKEFFLPKKEFELLLLLASRPGKVFNREEIFRKIWGDDVIVGERTIDVHIRKLREKIGNNFIITIKGVGYKFNDEEMINVE
jgi:two-component system alkaline phosphatase synthesis response regulator PhoP